MAMTIIPGATTFILSVIAPPLTAPTTPAPAATTTSRNVPQASEKSRRHSCAVSKKSGGAEAEIIRCSSVDPACSCCVGVIVNPLCPEFNPLGSDDFARDHGILIKLVNRAEPVITVGDNQLAVRFVPVQQQRR